jgi:putative CocE/NonD family hydrolase
MPDAIYTLARAALRLPKPKVGGVARRKDLTVPMTDGTVLLADHWIPAGNTKAPLLLVRTPYGRRALIGLIYGRLLAHQGFQVLVQSCRGTAGSQGTFDQPFTAEVDDGADTVAWMRKQPFYPGTFGTVGGSYLGYTQLALPPEAKSDLFAAVLQITPTGTRDMVLPDGNLALHTALGWSTATSRDISGPVRTLKDARRDARVLHEAGLDAPLLETYTRAPGRRLPHLDGWLDHPDASDPWWQAEDRSEGLETFDCPVLVQGGWWDAFLASSLGQYSRLAERGLPVRLTVGPWTHATFSTTAAGQVMLDAARFLRSAAGLDPALSSAPVQLQDSSRHRRIQTDTWPPTLPRDDETLYVTNARLVSEPSTAASGRTSFTYDPTDPTPSVGGITVDLTGGPKDNRKLESRSDVLTFDGPPASTGTTYLGSPTAELWVTADVPNPHLFVRLNVVDKKGRSFNLADRLVRVDLDGSAERGEPTRVEVVLSPMFREMQAGESLRVLIAGGAYPMFARSTGTAEPAATATTFLTAHITIHHDARFPSAVRLPRLALSSARQQAQPSRGSA